MKQILLLAALVLTLSMGKAYAQAADSTYGLKDTVINGYQFDVAFYSKPTNSNCGLKYIGYVNVLRENDMDFYINYQFIPKELEEDFADCFVDNVDDIIVLETDDELLPWDAFYHQGLLVVCWPTNAQLINRGTFSDFEENALKVFFPEY